VATPRHSTTKVQNDGSMSILYWEFGTLLLQNSIDRMDRCLTIYMHSLFGPSCPSSPLSGSSLRRQHARPHGEVSEEGEEKEDFSAVAPLPLLDHSLCSSSSFKKQDSARKGGFRRCRQRRASKRDDGRSGLFRLATVKWGRARLGRIGLSLLRTIRPVQT
jgi:hypothetical protein